MCGDFIDSIGSSLGNFFGGAGDALSSGASAVGNALEGAGNAVASGASDLGNVIGDGVSNLFSGNGTGAGQAVADAGLGADQGVGGGAGSFSADLAGAASDVGVSSGGAGGGIAGAIPGLAPEAGNYAPVVSSLSGNGVDPNLQAILDDPNASASLMSKPETVGSSVYSPYEGGANGVGEANIPPVATAPVADTSSAAGTNWMDNSNAKPSLASSLFSDAKNYLPSSSTLKDILGATTLGATAVSAMKPAPTLAQNTKAVNALPLGAQQLANADTLSTAAKASLSGITTGVLPTGLQQGIDQQTAAAKQAIKGRYASLGMSGSSSEATDLAAADAQAVTQKATIAQQLAQTGIAAAGGANTDYNALAKQVLNEDQQFSAALASLAGTFNGSRGSSRTAA